MKLILAPFLLGGEACTHANRSRCMFRARNAEWYNKAPGIEEDTLRWLTQPWKTVDTNAGCFST